MPVLKSQPGSSPGSGPKWLSVETGSTSSRFRVPSAGCLLSPRNETGREVRGHCTLLIVGRIGGDECQQRETENLDAPHAQPGREKGRPNNKRKEKRMVVGSLTLPLLNMASSYRLLSIYQCPGSICMNNKLPP